MYIDDRWLYEQEGDLPPVVELDLLQRPKITQIGSDVTIVASGHASLLARQGGKIIGNEGISAEVIDVRVLNPFFADEIVNSVKKTQNLLVVDQAVCLAVFQLK